MLNAESYLPNSSYCPTSLCFFLPCNNACPVFITQRDVSSPAGLSANKLQREHVCSKPSANLVRLLGTSAAAVHSSALRFSLRSLVWASLFPFQYHNIFYKLQAAPITGHLMLSFALSCSPSPASVVLQCHLILWFNFSQLWSCVVRSMYVIFDRAVLFTS